MRLDDGGGIMAGHVLRVGINASGDLDKRVTGFADLGFGPVFEAKAKEASSPGVSMVIISPEMAARSRGA